MTAAAHTPVLLAEVVAALAPQSGSIIVDGTFGAGGYSRALLDTAPCRVIGIDRDPDQVARAAGLAAAYAGRLTVLGGRFGAMDELLAEQDIDAVDGVALDLGVSSMQLDEAERGFSFRHNGPLDMRMGGAGPSAADLVNAASGRDLASIISTLGEERFARPIARAIIKARDEAPITTTRALSDVVGTVLQQRPGEIHPATRTFQALRMFVNDELGELAAGLVAAERVLKPGGRLVVISFHSLEDRIVKTFLAERGATTGGSRHLPEVKHAAPSFHVLTKRPVIADEAEVAANPRARSAKLRAGERTEAPAFTSDTGALLPRVPTLDDVMRGR